MDKNFVTFVGLYLLKLPIPEDLFEYIQKHECPYQYGRETRLIIQMLIGTPDIDDENLRSMILSLL